MSATDVPSTPAGRLAELRLSARGWHGVQLAVIGFVGLCGVLHRESDAAPTWLEVLAGIMVLSALALACLATFLVGRVAWPLYGSRRGGTPDDAETELPRAGRRMTTGLLLTFVAVGLLALASASSWWPSGEDASASSAAASVEVRAQGQAFCGQLREGSPGGLLVQTAGRPVRIPIAAVSAIRPVGGC